VLASSGSAFEFLGLVLVVYDAASAHAAATGGDAPEKRVWAFIASLPTKVRRGIRAFIFGPRLTRPANLGELSAHATLSGKLEVSAAGQVVRPPTLPKRVELLEKRVGEFEERLSETRSDLGRGLDAIRDELAGLGSHVEREQQEQREAETRTRARTFAMTKLGFLMFTGGALMNTLGSVQAHC
jgi:hypothetical protein